MNYEKIRRVQDTLKPILRDWGSGEGMDPWDIDKFIDAMAEAIAERLEIKTEYIAGDEMPCINLTIHPKSPEVPSGSN